MKLLEDILRKVRDLEYDEARDLRDFILELLDEKGLNRKGRPPVALAMIRNRKLDQIASECVDLSESDQRLLVSALAPVIAALRPVEYRRGGEGHAQFKYITRKYYHPFTGEYLGSKTFGPYGYIRIWATGGDHNKERRILRNVYIGKIFGTGLAEKVVTSEEVIQAWHLGDVELAKLEEVVHKRLKNIGIFL